MKKLALLLPLLTFNAFAANARLTIVFENLPLENLNKAFVTFESTTPLCKQVKNTGVLPIAANRTKRYELSIDKVNANTVYIESPTIDPKNDTCKYKFAGISLSTKGLMWFGLSTTRDPDYDKGDEAINVTKNPRNRIEAECRAEQCQKRANGAAIGYASNAIVIYADDASIDKNLDINANLKVKVYR